MTVFLCHPELLVSAA